MKLDVLKGAIKHVEENENPSRAPIEVLIQAAKDLQTLIEAREKATAGKWEIRGDLSGDFFIDAPQDIPNAPYGIEVMCDDFYEDDQDVPAYKRSQRIAHAELIVLCANTLEKHTER